MPSTDDLVVAVGAMARQLHPGGVLVVDGWVRPDAWVDGGLTEVAVAATQQKKVVRMGRSRRQGHKTYLEMHHLIATADGIEHLVDHHELTLFTPHDYEDAFRRAGIVVETVESPMPGRDRYIGITPATPGARPPRS